MMDEQDMAEDKNGGRDWCPVSDGFDFAHSSMMDFEMNRILAVGLWTGGQLNAEPVERSLASRIEDWPSD